MRSGHPAVHPAVGGVLYLGDSGGATAVFGQTRRPIFGGGGATSLRPRFPREIAVVHPRRNRLLLFEGDRYHAVLSPSAPPANITGQRVTLRELVDCETKTVHQIFPSSSAGKG